ncbi:MAG: GNAT family N-acetyltransferase [Caldilineaceae bacterium]|jgi:amino-acid N-acetyltransferase|nr:GNAT family N-acetyltransferase [Caldilineaceae bacterium]
MPIIIQPAAEAHVLLIIDMVNTFAAENVMLPRTEESVRQTLADWLVAVDPDAAPGEPRILACGALVPLTDALIELRSLAVHSSQQGKGLGGHMVLHLVQMARQRGYQQICALTLRENFFVRLGFTLVDRWSISPKVWQACIYCPKFHRCDEVAVMMNLTSALQAADHPLARPAGWNNLLKWSEWQPLKLAYKQKQGEPDRI